MVVFAGTGLDSMAKQLIEDALPLVASRDEKARAQLRKFAIRYLRREPQGEEFPFTDIPKLADLLLTNNPAGTLIKELVLDLTGGSLQSASQIFRTLEFFGINPADHEITEKELKPVFDCRNTLIHEFDIDFTQRRRKRFPRKRDDMITNAEQLLRVSAKILRAVDDKLE